MDENIVDVDTELEDVLENVLPDFQDVIKRAFTNAVIQSTKTSTANQTYSLGDVSFNSENNQINLSHLQLAKAPSYRLQSLNVDLSCNSLSLRCSLGEVHVKGLFSAINEDLYKILPAVSEGHLQISLDNVCAEVESGLLLHEDSFLPINPGVQFSHDEVSLRISWPSPKESGGYEFTTTEKLAAHIDDLPVTAAISQVLTAMLRRQLLSHLELVLVRAAGFSELLNCNLLLMDAYSKKINLLTADGNKAIDIVLMHVRKTLLQGRNELLQLPQLRANFTQKVGILSFIGKFETANGWIKDLATVNRTGDVSVRPGDNANSLYVTLRIRDLKLGFDEYLIKLMGMSPVGRVLVAIEESSVHVALTAGIQDWKTYTEINHLKIDYFDKLDVHVTGLGPLSWLVARLRGWLAGYMHAHVLPLVEKQLTHEFNQAFQAINIWHISNGIKS